MKKLLILVLLLGTIVASARTTTWNIRLGGGLQGGIRTDLHRISTLSVGDRLIGPAPGVEFLLQPNIALGEKKRWVFTPSLQVGNAFGGSQVTQFSTPLLFGYRVKMGKRSMYVAIPK